MLARESLVINTMNTRRWATYRVALGQRQQEIALMNAANARSAQAAVAQAAAVSASAPQVTYVQSAPIATSSAS